jgi:tetratricopeptide (TPR) repeat protein
MSKCHNHCTSECCLQVDLEDIYSSFYDIGPDNSMGIIRLYENNQIILDNQTTFIDKDDFKEFVILMAQYVISLEKMGKYTKSIKYADRLLQLIDSKKDEFEILINDFTSYWSVLTSKGRSLYNLKDYKSSILIFERLLEWDSDNDNFRLWLDTSKSRKREFINRYLYIASSILIFTHLFIGDSIINPKIKNYMLGLGIILFIIALLNEHLVEKILKMIKKK